MAAENALTLTAAMERFVVQKREPHLKLCQQDGRENLAISWSPQEVEEQAIGQEEEEQNKEED